MAEKLRKLKYQLLSWLWTLCYLQNFLKSCGHSRTICVRMFWQGQWISKAKDNFTQSKTISLIIHEDHGEKNEQICTFNDKNKSFGRFVRAFIILNILQLFPCNQRRESDLFCEQKYLSTWEDIYVFFTFISKSLHFIPRYEFKSGMWSSLILGYEATDVLQYLCRPNDLIVLHLLNKLWCISSPLSAKQHDVLITTPFVFKNCLMNLHFFGGIWDTHQPSF